MKKTIALMLAIVMVMGMAGCNKETKERTTPVSDYSVTTTKEDLENEYGKDRIIMQAENIRIEDVLWRGLKGHLSFYYSADKLTKVVFYANYGTKLGHTQSEIQEAYENAENAYIFVRDYYKLNTTKNYESNRRKQHTGNVFLENGEIICDAGWVEHTGPNYVMVFSIQNNIGAVPPPSPTPIVTVTPAPTAPPKG